MAMDMTEAEERFLEAAANDLQRQLGIAGDVESLAIDEFASFVTLTASVAVRHQSIRLVGSGVNVVDAYRALTRYYPAEAFLAASFREVLER